jgi:hypothetical protein
MLRDVALNDSEPEVRSTAIQYLARSPSDVAVSTLDEILRTTTDQNVLRTAARALAANPSPRARQSVPDVDRARRCAGAASHGSHRRLRDSQRTTDEDAAYLRGLYPKIDNPRIKARIARVIGQLGGDANDQWLMGLMRNNDEPLGGQERRPVASGDALEHVHRRCREVVRLRLRSTAARDAHQRRTVSGVSPRRRTSCSTSRRTTPTTTCAARRSTR